ncbi:MAG: EscR/YscR/HrcR family type III secretion system export apparatus protein [Chlamydiales bacterium]|nr:type III secretion system export apparatus subunit SctR [Chlamydiales bacterium]NCF70129.1 EscR/YscR/HrcR family type III secretion system export apparatus protein [Chlamydiales bacterium]
MIKKCVAFCFLLTFFTASLAWFTPVFSQSSTTNTSIAQNTPGSGKFSFPSPQKILPNAAPAVSALPAGNQEVDLVTQSMVLVGLSLLPFFTMLLTSFTKIVIVMSLLRNAIGVQQSPPNQVLNGMALILTVYVMAPTGLAMYDASQEVFEKKWGTDLFSRDTAGFAIELVEKAKEPFKDFLYKNSLAEHRISFLQLANKSFPEPFRSELKQESFIILVPSYISSQIRNAFEIGVLVYLPFFVIDIVTSNVLLAMGMMMMSPMSISLPLKLLLVVMLDGWTMLVQGLVLSYN